MKEWVMPCTSSPDSDREIAMTEAVNVKLETLLEELVGIQVSVQEALRQLSELVNHIAD